MIITKKQDGDKLVISLNGRLDTTTVASLEEELGNSLEGIKDLEFDFSELEYISSAGLRVLLATQKKMTDGKTMKITHVNDLVNEIFEVTGFQEFLTIE
ncbi:MAG: STAS domain-containing protein [Solobacterium sp.]|nr:STAS domain-containing protein [Solobacterium sp.]